MLSALFKSCVIGIPPGWRIELPVEEDYDGAVAIVPTKDNRLYFDEAGNAKKNAP